MKNNILYLVSKYFNFHWNYYVLSYEDIELKVLLNTNYLTIVTLNGLGGSCATYPYNSDAYKSILTHLYRKVRI